MDCFLLRKLAVAMTEEEACNFVLSVVNGAFLDCFAALRIPRNDENE
jgi:hypothetical protein